MPREQETYASKKGDGLTLFEDLASQLHVAWRKRGRDERAFPEVALSALESFAAAREVTLENVFGWLASTDRVPRQFDPSSSFGNFALTVASRDDFHIDVLIWTHSTTAIHQHNFSGAFQVLQGSSLHTVWSFQETRRWSDRVKHGQLSVSGTELLRPGGTRMILPGESMIHSLFHLESPTVTVVVRTPSAAVRSPQLAYERSGLAYDDHLALDRVEKLSQMLRMLWSSGHPQRVALSEAALAGADAHSAVRMILAMQTAASDDAQARLIDLLTTHDAELATLLRETAAHRRRSQLLVALRKKTQSPRHRLLLALALNLPTRASIDSVLRQLAPGEPPGTWLWETIRSMFAASAEDPIFGFSLDEVSEETLELLLRGHSSSEVSKAVAGHEELVADVRSLCSTLARLPVVECLLDANAAAG